MLAAAIALVWLVGMTNAFNLLDNMDGLAATLAAIASGFFAIDAVDRAREPRRARARARRSRSPAPASCRSTCAAASRRAVFMGDSGSQVLGFALAALGLAASWKVAGTTVATLILPILVLAVPILDTTLVTIVRLLEGRPIYQGGRDHTLAPARATTASPSSARSRCSRIVAPRSAPRASPTPSSTTSGSR